MNFLLYVENSAENLQFYLWFRDYEKRFDQLPENEKKLSPTWIPEQSKPKIAPARATDPDMTVEEKRAANHEVNAAIKGTDFDSKVRLTVVETGHNPFNTPPRTPTGDADSLAPSTVCWNEDSLTLKSGAGTTHTKKSADAFEAAKTFQPCQLSCIPFQYLLTHIPQSLFNHLEKRSHASSPRILQMMELAVSICRTRSPPNSSVHYQSPHTLRHSERS